MMRYADKYHDILKKNQDVVASYENKDFLKENVEFNLQKGPDEPTLKHFVMREPLYIGNRGEKVHTYFTDRDSAEKNDYYGRNILINSFEGRSKTTFGLESNPNHFYPINFSTNKNLVFGFCWKVPSTTIFSNLNDSLYSYKDLNPEFIHLWDAVQKAKIEEIEGFAKFLNVSYGEATEIWKTFKPIRELYQNHQGDVFELFEGTNLLFIKE